MEGSLSNVIKLRKKKKMPESRFLSFNKSNFYIVDFFWAIVILMHWTEIL